MYLNEVPVFKSKIKYALPELFSKTYLSPPILKMHKTKLIFENYYFRLKPAMTFLGEIKWNQKRSKSLNIINISSNLSLLSFRDLALVKSEVNRSARTIQGAVISLEKMQRGSLSSNQTALLEEQAKREKVR